jgi:DNA polymerase-3 subunit gamma/tau
MSYQALYRVWRPRRFDDVVGQTHITQTLKNAIREEKFSHAYLFTGPRGTGKTSAAKIFAKTINCEKSPVEEPCNECDACLGIQDGSISDIIEIDAASNTSVDDIREIRDKVKYAPSVVPYKVYIIDEVHMISVNAFNALLKTLEEPPKHVVFILATTEPHKIPLTIISRCQRFDFKPIGNEAIVDRMKTIIEADQQAVSEDALDAIARTAEGGMRDALSILDQAISYSGDEVRLEDVLAVTGGVSQGILTEITKAMFDNDVEQAIGLLDEIIQEGKDPGRFVYDLIYFMRDLLLFKSNPQLESMLERARVDDAFHALAEEVDVDWIQDAITRLNTCQQEIKWSNSPKVYIEIAIIAIADSAQAGDNQASVSNEEVIQLTQKLQKLEKELTRLKENPQAANQPSAPREQRRSQTRAPRNSFKIPTEKIYAVLREAEKQELKNVQGNWATFLEKLKATNAPAHATIQDSKPVAASPNSLVVAFKYEIHCSLFMDNREIVESVLHTVLGKPFTITPIPDANWLEVRQNFIDTQDNKPVEKQEEKKDPLIEEARKLVGDDLLEIQD